MSEQREVFEQIWTSPNFLLILVGAAIWLIAPLTLLLAPLVSACGFALTIIATAQAAMSRPISSALPGLLIGGLFYVVAPFTLLIPLAGLVIAPILSIIGNVMLLFYGFSIALQRIDIPVVKNLEDFLQAQQKKREEPEPEPEIIDVEEIVDETEDEETDQ